MNTKKNNNIDISIIIPQKNSLCTIPRLFASIPDTNRVEIILVDNSDVPVKKEDIKVSRDFKLLWASPSRFAGGARNEGMKVANGKWLLFADADDFFTKDAFDLFFSLVNDDADIIYFGMTGIYSDTGEYSSRGEYYTNMVKNYLAGKITEEKMRFLFGTPCSKMIKRELVEKYNLLYDEVVVCNDSYFSTTCGYYANKIKAIDHPVYVATVTRGSLTRRTDFVARHSKYLVTLRINKFLRDKNQGAYQIPIASYIKESLKFGISRTMLMLWEAIKYKQNIFIKLK